MKEIIVKSKVFHENFPKILRKNKTSITDKNVITDKFNDVFYQCRLKSLVIRLKGASQNGCIRV